MSGSAFSFVKERGKRSAARRTILASELGIRPDHLGSALSIPITEETRGSAESPTLITDDITIKVDTAKRAKAEEEEEEVYKDSSVFLKGTQSANPHNDYSQHFVNTGQRPQNSISDSSIEERYAEYPRLRELVRLKEDLFHLRATPPMYLKADLATFSLASLNSEFDVILIDPPLPEYARRPGVGMSMRAWDWSKICDLKISMIAASSSFVFLWVGAAEGLEEGRKALKYWGFRRCEDICWIKTNKTYCGPAPALEEGAVLQHTKEHCLVGIRGNMKRSVDSHFVHANIDIDLIISEEPPPGRTDKPDEMFSVIERFCLGRRRLHLFAPETSLRPGWVSVGPDLAGSNYNSAIFLDYFRDPPPDTIGGKPSLMAGVPNTVLGSWNEIEQLRPKSPPRRGKPGKPQPT